MKRLSFFLSFMLVILVGCTTMNEVDQPIAPSDDNRIIYTATFEDSMARVFLDDEQVAHWNADDEISVFATTYNQRYRFVGSTGDTNGSFAEVSGSFFSGAGLDAIYAVYPYNEDTSINTDGVISLRLPEVQQYAENSYGLRGNTMVAVTESSEDRNLCFKNLCGYIVLRLYGEGIIKSITLSGNNDEKIAGAATVVPMYGKEPVVTMSASATTSITLDCGEGIPLGKTSDEATPFWIAVPPISFTHGFTIRIEREDSWAMEKTTFTCREVVRKVKNATTPLMVNFTIPTEGNIVFKDSNFKAYCLDHFDIDSDNEVSFDEAKAVTTIDCSEKGIENAEGVQYFTALEELNVSGNPLATINLSGNRNLKRLVAKNTNVTEMDLRYNTHLQTVNLLHCETFHSVLVRGFDDSEFPFILAESDIVFKAQDNSTKALPSFGYPLLIVPTDGSLFAAALTDLVGIGYKSPIEGMNSPSLEEAKQFTKQYDRYHDLINSEGFSELEEIEFITSTPTGETSLHEHTFKTGAYWTTRNFLFSYYYCFTLRGVISNYGLTCADPSTCPANLQVHKTGFFLL